MPSDIAFLVEIDSQRRHPIADHVSLGRGPDADIRLEDPLIGARHAEIARHADGGWAVRDLGSRRGTFLGARKIQEERLRDGDELLIGPVRLRFELTRPAATRSPPGPDELDRLRAVVRLSQVIGVEHDLVRTLDRVLATCLELTGADRAAIVVYEPRSSAPRLTRHRTRDGDDRPFSLSTCVLSHVMASQTPFLGTAVDPESALHRAHSMTAHGVRSLMVVPIFYQGETREWIGVLHVDSNDQRQMFGPHDLELVCAIASQAAFAIKNALLVEQVQSARDSQWARLERIVRDLPVGVIALDDRGECVVANRWVTERQALLGEITPGAAVAAIAGVPCDQLRVGDRIHQVDVGAPPRNLSLAVQSARDGAETIVVVSDGTDERARQAQANHQDRLAIIGQLAGGIAHDFNNLLMVIGSYAGFLEQGLEEPLKDDARQIGIAASHAADLTRQLLTFSRRESIQPKVVDVAATVGTMDRLMRRALGSRVALVVRIDPDVPRILSDPSELEQVLMNLLINARDASPDGARVMLSVARAGAQLLIEVADHGTGIAPDALPRVFDPYFTTKARGVGTGLGLATVRGIVQRAGGTIDVESRLGVGTTFRILIPETTQQRDETNAVAAAGPADRRTILVVDDDEQIRRVVERMLRSAGYDVLAASSGRAALALVDTSPCPIDLVLSDLVMPGMSGRELLVELSRTRPDLTVVLMSGYHEELLRPDTRCLMKPFDRARLLRAVADAL